MTRTEARLLALEGWMHAALRGDDWAGPLQLSAELLGARVPRHAPLPPRPGLCWLVGDGETRLAQAAS